MPNSYQKHIKNRDSEKAFCHESDHRHFLLVTCTYSWIVMKKKKIPKYAQVHLMLEAKFRDDSKLTNSVTKKTMSYKKRRLSG